MPRVTLVLKFLPSLYFNSLELQHETFVVPEISSISDGILLSTLQSLKVDMFQELRDEIIFRTFHFIELK